MSYPADTSQSCTTLLLSHVIVVVSPHPTQCLAYRMVGRCRDVLERGEGGWGIWTRARGGGGGGGASSLPTDVQKALAPKVRKNFFSGVKLLQMGAVDSWRSLGGCHEVRNSI